MRCFGRGCARSPSLWPVFLTAGLFGVSVLGAQAPLSTFARTDAAEVGYGLGATSFQTSLLVGAYVLSLVVGAMLFPLVTRWVTPRVALIGASSLVALGYLLFLPFHDGYVQVLVNMIIAVIGSGALVAALPAAAAAAAPAHQTGVATGLTNSVKTVGGAIASCVFGIALLGAAGEAASGTAGSFAGYVTVWLVCGITAAVAAVSRAVNAPRWKSSSMICGPHAKIAAAPSSTMHDTSARSFSTRLRARSVSPSAIACATTGRVTVHSISENVIGIWATFCA